MLTGPTWSPWPSRLSVQSTFRCISSAEMATDEHISKRRRADPAAGDGPAPAAVSPEYMELSIGAAALADSDAAAGRNSHASASQSGMPATAPAARQPPCGSVPTAAAASVRTLAPAGASGLSNVARLIRLPGREVMHSTPEIRSCDAMVAESASCIVVMVATCVGEYKYCSRSMCSKF